MQDFIEKIYRNFLDFYSNLEASKKMGLIAVSAFIIASMVAIVVWASKTRYETLYSDLNKDDAKKVAVTLEEKGISYQMANGGETIRIPSDMVSKWRLELANMGVDFSGTVGYEVFDKQSFGTTNFVQRVNRQRALEGELVKTIRHIEGVKRARVHLTIPKSSPFVSEKKPPKASVVIELNRGVNLSNKEVKGIASLVGSAVEGLENRDVVILNDDGKKLSENIGDDMTANTANRMALQGKMNRKYEDQIEEILGKVVGNGKVIAKVNVNMDYTQSVSTETSYEREGATVVSEVNNSQKINGSRPSPQGIPGARSNLPGEEPQPGIPETKNDVDKELSTKNYNVPQKVTKSKKPSATVEKISAAVMIDGKKVPVFNENGKPVMNESGEQKMQYEGWSEADLTNFRDIVASSIGINPDRGDSITIKNMEFAEADMEAMDKMIQERETRDLIKSIVKYVAVGLTITLFFFLVVRPFIQWITDNTVESVEDFLPKTLEELEKVQADQKLPGLEDALPQIEEKINPEKIEGNMLREKIISLVESNPGKAAQVVHEMIHSSDSNKDIA